MTVLALAGGLWLALFTSGITADPDADDDDAAVSLGTTPATSPREIANAALTRLEGSPNSPPADAIESLLELGETIHLMMSTGEVEVTDTVVEALSNAADDRVKELLDEIAFHAPDPWVQLRAAQALLEQREPLGVQAVLELLEVPQPTLLQLEAIGALRDATAQSFGYDPEGEAGAKREALDRWTAWWEVNAAQPFADAGNAGRL